ncbi:MAG: GNAT family N-acetyltransferase [Bosea sp. (in: a-proteobacteria)]
MTAIIRPMRAGDRDSVLGLLMELAAHEAGLSATRATGPATAQALLADDCAEALDQGGAQFVADIEGVCVGYLALRFGETGPYVLAPLRRHVLVENIVVASAQRGRGLGQALLAEAERFARAAGCQALHLGVLPGNGPALAAYERAGFSVFSIEMSKRLD